MAVAKKTVKEKTPATEEISAWQQALNNAQKFFWLERDKENIRASAKKPKSCLLLLDIQRENAIAAASQIIQNAICKNQNACGNCQNCRLLKIENHPDLFFFTDALKIEEVRELLANINQTPSIADKRFVFLGNIDRYNESSLNALLKTLEEPSEHNFFILSAPAKRSVKATILSRSTCLAINPPSPQDAAQYLRDKNWQETQIAAILPLYQHNPFAAEFWQDKENPLALFGQLATYCKNPKQNRAFLQELNRIPDKDKLPVLLLNLRVLIEYLQLDKLPSTWQNQPPSAISKKDIDINRLHSLNAALNKLLRPNQQQLGVAVNINSLFLQYIEQRNYSL
ncbi:MAG: hypothetical protein IJ566_03390 [Cardiobacteriaceae bacterium]|nr:hypothetical protein [Cardiobacteriaceae bacterium]